MMDLLKANLNELNCNARYLFEVSDQGALKELFEGCEDVEEINKAADSYKEAYPDLFE